MSKNLVVRMMHFKICENQKFLSNINFYELYKIINNVLHNTHKYQFCVIKT